MATRHLRDTAEGRIRQLTPQELRIFGFVGQGLTNFEIGDRLGLTEKTVKNYMSHVLAKLQLRHHTEVAALWARRDERRRLDGRAPLCRDGAAPTGRWTDEPAWVDVCRDERLCSDVLVGRTVIGGGRT